MPAYDVKDSLLMVCKHYLLGVDNRRQVLYTLDRPVHDISAAHQLKLEAGSHCLVAVQVKRQL